MAERLPRYRPLGIRLAPPARVDFAGAGAAEAASYQRLSSALDKISSYAFEEAGRRAKIEGEEFGYKLGQNPEQIKTALEAGANIDDIVGDPDTIFGAASRAAVGAQLRVELETDVRSKLAQLSAAIDGGDIVDPADVETEIDAITDGHSSLLSQFGGKYAAQYRATIGTLAAPVYKSALEQSYKLRNAAIAAKFTAGMESFKDIAFSIYNDYQGGQTKIDGQVVLDADATFDVASRSLIDQAINTKNPANIDRAREFVKDMRTNAKVNALRKFARENPSDVNLNAGLFGNKTALYFSLDEDAKEKVRDEIRDERAALYQETENQITLSKRKNQTRVNQINADLATMPHYDERRPALVAELESIAKSGIVAVDADDLRAAHNPSFRPAQESSPEGIERVRRMIIEGRITDATDLDAELGYNEVRGKEANELREKLIQFNNAQQRGVISFLKERKGAFGTDVPKDVGAYISEALPEIEKMNEIENQEREAKGQRPELLIETAKRYVQEGLGDKKLNDLTDARERLQQGFGQYVNFDFANAGPKEIQDYLDRLDGLRLKRDIRDDLRRQLKLLQKKLSQ